MLGTLADYKAKAQSHYKEAFTLFKHKQVNHLIGTYLSKKGERRTLPESSDDEGDRNDERMSLQCEIKDEEAKLIEFDQKVGLENNSCYILREHGEEISLMADIVWQKQTQQFFLGENAAKNTPLGRSETYRFNAKESRTNSSSIPDYGK